MRSWRRTSQEIGIRAALGARPREVLQMVLSQGMKLFLTGAGAGLAAAYALSHLMAHVLYGIGAGDPLSFGVAALILGVVTMLACYLPARRAMRMNTNAALRYE